MYAELVKEFSEKKETKRVIEGKDMKIEAGTSELVSVRAQLRLKDRDIEKYQTEITNIVKYVDEHLYNIIFSVAKYLHLEMKSYTLRPDTFTLNFNFTLSGTSLPPPSET